MTFDYDLVIVGATMAGEAAAIAATDLYARVAWILESEFQPDYVALFESLAVQVGQGLTLPMAARAMPWLIEQWQLQHSLAALQARGVDVLIGDFQFQTTPSLAVEVGHRRLRSRTYLLALPSPLPPPLQSVATLWQTFSSTPLAQWPTSITCVGNTPQAASLCHALKHLGRQVVWEIDSDTLLPTEDSDLVQWLQVDLEACGLTVWMGAAPSPQDFTLKEHNAAAKIMGPELDPLKFGALERLSNADLAALTLRRTATGIWTDSTLQTSRSQVYACGALLGGYSLTDLAVYEAEQAVQNVLFQRHQSIQYQQIPYRITPNAVRVGLTEQQALAYDPTTEVIHFPTLNSDRFLQRSPTLQFCKIMMQPQGKILGAHLGGTAAQDLSYLIALAIQQNASFASLAMHPLLYPVVAQWQARSHRSARDRLERQFYRQRRR